MTLLPSALPVSWAIRNARMMKDWLVADGIPADEIDIADTSKLIDQWENEL